MAPRQHKAVLHCQYLQRTVGSAGFFSPRLGPQKCSVDKILLLASPASRGSHEEEEKTGTSEHDRPCWVGGELSRKGKGGKSSVSFSFFCTFPFRKDPRWVDTQLCLSQEARRTNAALALPVNQAVSRATERCLNTWQTGNWWDAVLIMWVQEWPWQQVYRANRLYLKPCTKGGSLRAERWNKTVYDREKGSLWGRNTQRNIQSRWK